MAGAAPAGAGAAGAPAAAVAEDVFPPGLIKFQDTDLVQVLDLYQELTGRTVMRPSSLPQTKITIRTQTELTRREAIQALDTVLAMNQITMIPQGEKFVKAVPVGTAAQEAPKFNTFQSSTNLVEAAQYVWQIVRLTNALPKDIAPALQPFMKAPNSVIGVDSAGILILRDYAENVKRMMEVIEQIDVVPLQEFEPVVIPIKYALAGDIAQVLGSLTAGGGGGTTVGRQQTRTGLTTGGFGTGAGGVGGQTGFGQPGTYPGQPGYQQGAATGLGGGGFGSAAAGRSSFADRLRSIVARAAGGDIVVLGQTKIIADERTNSLLIFASKQDMIAISNIIEKLDVVLPQVLIEALIFEIGLNESLEYGISYIQRKPSQIGDNAAGIGALKNDPPGLLSFDSFTSLASNGIAGANLPGGFSYFARTADLDITARAVAGDGNVKVLSRPRVQTSHAVEANLFVGQTRPYPMGTGYGGYGGGYYGGYGYGASIQQLQIGITLSVLPLINVDGLVVMDIRQKIQNIGEEIPIANVGNVPSTIDREANAKVAVKDRETIALGGFISNEKRTSNSGVPILKDIPLFGVFFRSNSRKDQRVELMILIRPTVLPSPKDASVAAIEDMKQLPGVLSTYHDFTNYNARLLDKANRTYGIYGDRKEQDVYRKEGFR